MTNATPLFATDLPGIAAYLVQDGLLTADDCRQALTRAAQQRLSLIHYLVNYQRFNAATILQCCAQHFVMPTFDLQQYDVRWLKEGNISHTFIITHRVIPLQRDEHLLYLGITDPADPSLLAMTTFHCGWQVQPMLVNEAELERVIQCHIQPNQLQEQLDVTLAKITPEFFSHAASAESSEEPVTAFVQHLLSDAIHQHASDIHLDPAESHYHLRFRRDGLLADIALLPTHLAARVIMRLKIMANLNIAERRLPQDGRLHCAHPAAPTGQYDVRLNLCPTLFGEKAALRLLNLRDSTLSIDDLGFTAAQKKLFLAHLARPQGFILVTGPTGSGKTVTLYSALQYLNQREKNILSVEDPVEMIVPGINQVTIHPKIGLDFATALRAFLRQDPDIIMVGEIRDSDTAAIAMQAAQTGHLVLSTLHTNSAIDALVRLQSMGIATHHLIQSLTLIIAQRLIRKRCCYCQPVHTPSCTHCKQGYHGRTALFELLPITPTLTQCLLAQASRNTLLQTARQEGLLTLWETGLQTVAANLTTHDELHRILTPECSQET